MNNSKRDLTVYVLVRNDIPSMNPGKAMAQVHHAGVQMMSQYNHSQMVRDYVADGSMGFNTTITLAANLSQINMIFDKVNDLRLSGFNNFIDQEVIDPSYPFQVNREIWEWMLTKDPMIADVSHDITNGMVLVTRSETTCAWFLGDRNDTEFKSLFEGLELYD